ncbi:MAG: NAD-dependent epimerase/dehydratase family protein [Jatrophihabitans sp.]
MHVLVTGHLGYLGVIVSRVLGDAGHDVVGLDSGYYDGCSLGPEPKPLPMYRCDIRDVQPMHLKGIDAVIHLAALSNDPVGDLAPEITYEINHHASVRLALLARDAGVRRFLYSSTCSVYGAAGGDDLVDEDAPLRPVTPYAISKVRVEDELHALADSDFVPVSLRNATAYGFSPQLRADIVVNNLVGWAYLTGEVKVLSDGTPWRPLVHAEDIASAFLALLEADAPAVNGQAFNVGRQGENHRVRDIAAAVAATVPGCRVTVAGEAGNDPRSYRVDFSRLTRAVPAYRARWTMREGAEEIYAAYQKYGLSADDFHNKFVRLRRLAALQATGRVDQDLRFTSAELS